MVKRKHDSQPQERIRKEEEESKSKSKKARQSVGSKEKEQLKSISVAGNFQTIPLELHSNSFLSNPSSSGLKHSTPIHYIYARAHSSTSSTSSSNNAANSLPSDRTLFVANLPVDTTNQHLKTLFSKAGVVERVKLQLARNIGWTQKEEDEDEQDESDEEEEEEEEDDQTSGKGSKKKKGKSKNKSGPPKIIPLPSLNPRTSSGGNPFLPTSSSAHVIFLDSSSLNRCLNLISSSELPKVWKDPREELKKTIQNQFEEESEESNLNQPKKKLRTANEYLNYHSNKSGRSLIPPLGLEYFLRDFKSKRPPLESVKSFSDSTIQNYEWKRANPTKAGTVGSRIPGVSIGPNGELLDEDGFTIVQSGGKYGKAKGESGSSVGVVRNRKTKDNVSEASRNRKKKDKELQDFYRFQMREKKREQLANLRAQFEADKEKVKKLKASRIFKPF